MFRQYWLDSPVRFADSIENCFQYSEIDSFRINTVKNTVLLENGYAKAKLVNTEDWKTNVNNRHVGSITIIFTKYPLEKKDWITNYYVLLANRLKELFELDSSLNSKDIKWYLLLQTNCKVAQRAENMFHGILIDYSIVKHPVHNSDSKIKKLDDAGKRNSKLDSSFIKSTEWNDYYKNSETLYYIEPRKKNADSKKRKEPACPDFNQKRKFKLFKKRRKK